RPAGFCGFSASCKFPHCAPAGNFNPLQLSADNDNGAASVMPARQKKRKTIHRSLILLKTHLRSFKLLRVMVKEHIIEISFRGVLLAEEDLQDAAFDSQVIFMSSNYLFIYRRQRGCECGELQIHQWPVVQRNEI